MNTPHEQSPYGYASAELSSAEGSRTLACFDDRVDATFSENKDDDLWDDEKESDWNGCCEDPYDDEDEEEQEREWCD